MTSETVQSSAVRVQSGHLFLSCGFFPATIFNPRIVMVSFTVQTVLVPGLYVGLAPYIGQHTVWEYMAPQVLLTLARRAVLRHV